MTNWKNHTVNRIKNLSVNYKKILETIDNHYLDSHLLLISKKPELRSAVASLIQIKKNDQKQLAILYGDALRNNNEFNIHLDSFKNKVDIILLDNVSPLVIDKISLDRDFIHLGYDKDHDLDIFNKFKRIEIGE